jgi:hypothetical protein
MGWASSKPTSHQMPFVHALKREQVMFVLLDLIKEVQRFGGGMRRSSLLVANPCPPFRE